MGSLTSGQRGQRQDFQSGLESDQAKRKGILKHPREKKMVQLLRRKKKRKRKRKRNKNLPKSEDEPSPVIKFYTFLAIIASIPKRNYKQPRYYSSFFSQEMLENTFCLVLLQ